ncbi:F-box/FBD/LRR-repeat protein [Pyrus ussuriensis x Pyrus communis]|uniref:F-box/FBD/LRR-repeat protein n=1 Tax=Pyrus ussuriensis x Pyrus communis TaxID=2448454 RepID=A0A5N5HEE4_9ROSA|nr:F-box/FBD/LRR-repeat protein [Pyrus ussuriensis x Pyrus communis]
MATQLQEFSLVCEEWTRVEEITRLIRIALQDRRAKKLNIDIAPAWEGGNPILPEIVYTSPDLVSLTMSKVMVQMSDGVVFLSLKSLKVDITHLSDPSCRISKPPIRSILAEFLPELAFEGMIDKFPDVDRHFRVSPETLKLFSLRLHSDFNYEMYYGMAWIYSNLVLGHLN